MSEELLEIEISDSLYLDDDSELLHTEIRTKISELQLLLKKSSPVNSRRLAKCLSIISFKV